MENVTDGGANNKIKENHRTVQEIPYIFMYKINCKEFYKILHNKTIVYLIPFPVEIIMWSSKRRS